MAQTQEISARAASWASLEVLLKLNVMQAF
jgi:hypothetical protein